MTAPRSRAPRPDERTDSLGRIAVDAARLGTWEYVLATGRITWNARTYELYGLDPSQRPTAEDVWARIHPEDLEAARRTFQEGLARDRYVNRYRVVLPPDGRIRWLQVDGQIFRDAAGSPERAVGVVSDVTELRESERAALHRLGEIEAIYRSARVGLCVFDRELRFVRINDRLAEINGQPVEVHLGRTVREMVPDLADWVEGLAGRIFATGEPALDVEVSGTTPAQPGVVRHWVEQWLPIRDEEGRVQAVNVAVEEVTERKRAQAELQHLADRLGRSNRDLEQFAYVASHDLQEPLRTMRMYLQMLESRHGGQLDPDARDCVHMALSAGEQMHALIEALLAYGRIQGRGRPPKPVRSGDCLDRALAQLAPVLASSGAQLARDPLPEVLADPVQLTQVFLNLVGNGVKFCKPGSVPRIRVGAESDGESWILAVSDEGIGIPPAAREKVFRIFQRLHHRDEIPGTGIGLALCKSIVERHGGRIWVEDGPSGGASFRFTLKAVQGEGA